MITDKTFNCQQCGSSDTWILIEQYRILLVDCTCNSSVKPFKAELTETNGIEIREDNLRYISKAEYFYELLDDQGCDNCVESYLSNYELVNSIEPVKGKTRHFLSCCECESTNEEIIHNAEFIQAIKQNLLFVMDNPLYAEAIKQTFTDTAAIELLETYAGLRYALAGLKYFDVSSLTPSQLEHHQQMFDGLKKHYNQLFGDSIELEN